MTFFPEVSQVTFEGPTSRNPLAFKCYNPDDIVAGKTMAEHLRFAVSYWHTFTFQGSDPFGLPTMIRPWNAYVGMDLAKQRVEANFEFLEKIGVTYFCFHDRDVAPEGETLRESNRNLDEIVSLIKDHMKSSDRGGASADAIYDALSQDDIRTVGNLLRPVYDRTLSEDGYVSLKVSPRLAHDTEGTIHEAHRLAEALGLPNVMIKVPATQAGIPAIRRLIRDGINVNVTLIFGVQNYEDVINAYLSGLEERLESGQPVTGISSVASFFIMAELRNSRR